MKHPADKFLKNGRVLPGSELHALPGYQLSAGHPSIFQQRAKGSAALELMLLLPVFLFFLGALWRFFHASHLREQKLIYEQHRFWKEMK